MLSRHGLLASSDTNTNGEHRKQRHQKSNPSPCFVPLHSSHSPIYITQLYVWYYFTEVYVTLSSRLPSEFLTRVLQFHSNLSIAAYPRPSRTLLLRPRKGRAPVHDNYHKVEGWRWRRSECSPHPLHNLVCRRRQLRRAHGSSARGPRH